MLFSVDGNIRQHKLLITRYWVSTDIIKHKNSRYFDAVSMSNSKQINEQNVYLSPLYHFLFVHSMSWLIIVWHGRNPSSSILIVKPMMKCIVSNDILWWPSVQLSSIFMVDPLRNELLAHELFLTQNHVDESSCYLAVNSLSFVYHCVN